MSQVSLDDVVDYLVEHSASNLPPEGLAEVFDRLLWCLDDNGEQLLGIRALRLRGDDERRVAIGLAMEEAFPADSREALLEIRDRVAARWPHLTSRADRIVAAWDDQHPQ